MVRRLKFWNKNQLQVANAAPERQRSELAFQCSKTGNPFVAVIEHNEPPKLHTVGSVERVEKAGWSLFPRLKKRSKMTVDSTSIDWKNFHCPWCGADQAKTSSHWVKCGGCQTRMCSHNVKIVNGKRFWAGHGECDSAGFIKTNSIALDASKSGVVSDSKSIISTPKNLALPPPDREKITKK